MDRFVIKPASKSSLTDFITQVKQAKQAECTGITQNDAEADRTKRPKLATSSSSGKCNSKANSSETASSFNSKLAHNKPIPDALSVADEWHQLTARVVSSVDITCQHREAQLQAKSYTGWKVDSSGAKVYTTFRNGQRVTAGGQEGFKLSCGDNKSKGLKRKTGEGKGNSNVCDTLS
ncbi:MAG: hypothetical protein EOO89_17865 [Pedobacter sp.]|nr:MAG: hypothetical protein EOO89_17865 [Pedobacter sp.]